MRARNLHTLGLLGLMLVVSLTAAAKTRDSSSPAEGDWKIEPQQGESGKIQFQLHREWTNENGHSVVSSSFDLRREDLSGLRREDWTSDHADVAFDLVRDAGTVHCQGVMRHGRGIGEYTFEPDARFAEEVERAGYGTPTPDEMMRFAIHDVDRTYLRGFQGRHDRIEDLIRFKVHDVTPAFVNTMSAGGYRDLSADDIVRFKVHGVDPSFVRELGGLGYDRPSPDDLVRLKVHGVSADYIRDLLALASPKPSMDDMIRMHIHGVEASYVKELRDAGFDRLPADDLVRLKVHGVSPGEARRARSRDRASTVDDVIRLKVRGEL